MKPIIVIMAGGRGERFWPRSRRNFPKQLLNILGDKSLLQEAVARIEELTDYQRIFIVANQDYRAELQRQLPFIPPQNILTEPLGRNTAPCVGLAAIYISKLFPDEDPGIVFLPSDSMVFNLAELRRVLKAGVSLCYKNNTGIIFGIRPSRAETGFGYIKLGKELGEVDGVSYYEVDAFKEKPDRKTAEEYLESKGFLWNGGVFIWKRSVLEGELEQHQPMLWNELKSLAKYVGASEESQRLQEIYANLESISVDYGILERSSNLVVIPTEYGWEDLGSWLALERFLPSDQFGNVLRGNHIGVDTQNCIIDSPEKTVTTLGVSDLIIVEASDVLMVCSKEQAPELKRLLQKIREAGKEELL